MKAAFTYTAIGILVVVVLIQIYYMNESYTDASGNTVDASGNMVTLSLSDLFYALRFNTGSGSSSNKTYDNLRDDLATVSTKKEEPKISEEDKNRLSKDIAKSIKDQNALRS